VLRLIRTVPLFIGLGETSRPCVVQCLPLWAKSPLVAAADTTILLNSLQGRIKST
jgi:hypothetical protein